MHKTEAKTCLKQFVLITSGPYLPADLVFFRGSGFLPKAIRIFTRSIGEPRTQVNHVGIIAPDVELIESLHTTIKRQFDPTEAFAVYRLEGITDDQRIAIAQTAMSYVGRRYGYGKILAHLGDWILGDRFVFRRLCRIDRYPICSWVAAWSYFRVLGYKFGTPPEAASPDSMWDNINRPINSDTLRGIEMEKIFDFSEALKHLKNGKKLCRQGWNGKGMWLILVKIGGPGSGYPSGGAVDCGEDGLWAVSDYVAMKTADDRFVPWLASQTDLLADDWMIA